MLEFANLVSAIQMSVQRASDALTRANYESFGRYFVEAAEPADARQILKDALREAASLSETQSPEEVVRRLGDSLRAASTALESKPTALQPRMVAIDYPMVTSEGPKVHTVHVPLISLAPIVGTQISRLVFKTTLDVQVDATPGIVAGSDTPPSAAWREGGVSDSLRRCRGMAHQLHVLMTVPSRLVVDPFAEGSRTRRERLPQPGLRPGCFSPSSLRAFRRTRKVQISTQKHNIFGRLRNERRRVQRGGWSYRHTPRPSGPGDPIAT